MITDEGKIEELTRNSRCGWVCLKLTIVTKILK
jgi:hypothetical protein